MAEAAQKTPVNPKKRGSSKAPPSGRRSPICAANSIECSRTFPGAGADWLGRLKAVAPTDRAVDVAANIAKATGSKLSILNVGGNLSGDEMPRRKGSRRCARCHLEPNCHAVQGASKTDRGVDHQGPSCLGRSGRGDHRSCPARAGECYRGRQTGQGGGPCRFAAGERVTDGRKPRSLHCDSRSIIHHEHMLPAGPTPAPLDEILSCQLRQLPPFKKRFGYAGPAASSY
jgi:hypothetical protein